MEEKGAFYKLDETEQFLLYINQRTFKEIKRVKWNPAKAPISIQIEIICYKLERGDKLETICGNNYISVEEFLYIVNRDKSYKQTYDRAKYSSLQKRKNKLLTEIEEMGDISEDDADRLIKEIKMIDEAQKLVDFNIEDQKKAVDMYKVVNEDQQKAR